MAISPHRAKGESTINILSFTRKFKWKRGISLAITVDSESD